MTLRLRRRVLRWGNGFGIRLSKREAQELGVRAGAELDVALGVPDAAEEVARLPAFALGGSADLDALLEEELDAGH